MGRSHGVHAEPTSFGLKLAGWWDEMRRNAHRLTHAKEQVAVGKISGPVGSHATVPPDLEEEVCGKLGLWSSRSPRRSSSATATRCSSRRWQ